MRGGTIECVFIYALHASALGQYGGLVDQFATINEGSNVACVGKPPGRGQCWDLAACAVSWAGIGPTWNCFHSEGYGGLAPAGWTPETDLALRREHRQRYYGSDFNQTVFGTNKGLMQAGGAAPQMADTSKTSNLVSPDRQRRTASKVETQTAFGTDEGLMQAGVAAPQMTDASKTSNLVSPDRRRRTSSRVEPINVVFDDYKVHPNCYVFGTPIQPQGATGKWQDIWLGRSTTFIASGVEPGDILQLDNLWARCSNGMYMSTAGAMHTAVVHQVLDDDLIVCQEHWSGNWNVNCGGELFFGTISRCPGAFTFHYDAIIIYRPQPTGSGGPPCNECPPMPPRSSAVVDMSSFVDKNTMIAVLTSPMGFMAGFMAGMAAMLALLPLLYRRWVSRGNPATDPLLQAMIH